MFSIPCLRRHFQIRNFNPSSVIAMASFDSSNTNEAIVRIKPDEANLTITLTVVGKSRILNRPKTEPLGRSLERLRLSISNPKGKNRKRKEELMSEVIIPTTVALYPSESKEHSVSETLSNQEAWTLGRYLVAGNSEYKVIINPPTVQKLELKDKLMVGHPICPLCTLAFAEEDSCEWKWCRQDAQNQDGVFVLSKDRVYTPTIDDLGSYLQVECIPVSFDTSYSDSVSNKRKGAPYLIKIGPVEQAPKASSSQGRQELTTQSTISPVFRILSYNILAGAYTSRPNAVDLIFKYCNPKFLDIDYRKQLVLNEILSYKADILCLQEVDTRIFETYLKLHLENNGFNGVFTQKSMTTREGSAVFVRRSRFSIKEHRSLVLNKILDSDLPQYLEPFRKMIECSENMRNALKAVGTIAQITIIEPHQEGGLAATTQESPLCLVNTHLLSNSFAEHIRMLHVIFILQEAKKTIAEYGGNAQVIFTGDLNSSPGDGVLDGSIQLLRDGLISSKHWEWKECAKFEWKQSSEDEESGVEEDKSTKEVIDPIEGVDLKCPLQLRSVMSLETPWTNYTDVFKGLLDYIWYQPTHLQLDRIIPLPTEELLEGPIPSEVYPSDHLAIIAELRFQSMDPLRRAELGNISLGVEALKTGKIIGVPTDTIYGLAGDAGDPQSINQLYSIKGRSLKVPLAVCVADPAIIKSFCQVEHLPSGLLDSLLPGSITIILSRKNSDHLSTALNPGLLTIGIRVPDCEFLRILCSKFGHPIALTSANSSGEVSSTSVEDFQHLWRFCSWVFDAGEVSKSFLGSTVVDLTNPGTFKIIRRGDGFEQILKTLQNFQFTQQD